MTIFTMRRLGVLMLCAVSVFATATAAPAGAEPVRAASVGIPGRYRMSVHWLGAGDGTLRVILNADGTAKLKNFDNVVTWTVSGADFEMIIQGGDPATFDGVITKRGISSAKHPGTMSNQAGDSGTWWALKRPRTP
jgi:hypothetical protein